MLPRNSGPIHFIGIGGIGMSGIAEILHNLGFPCRARTERSANVLRLRQLGVHGRPSATRPRTSAAPRSPSSPPRSSRQPRARRGPRPPPAGRPSRRDAGRADAAEVLGRGRRHPRQDHDHVDARRPSSTPASLDPTVINGGIINAYGTNARLGAGEWMVVEADESDGTFLSCRPTDRDRHQHRPRAPRPLRRLRGGQRRLRQLRREHAVLRLRRAVHRPPRGADACSPRITDRRVVTYGFSPQADVRAVNLAVENGGEIFDVVIRARGRGGALASRESTSRCPAATTSRTRSPPSPSPASSASRRGVRERSRASAASSAASPAPARSTA